MTIGMRPASEAPWTLFWPRSGCRPVPGRPTWPQSSASEIRQRELSVPWMCWETPMPQKIIAARAPAKVRATSRIIAASTPQTGAIFSGVKPRTCSAKASKPSVKPSIYWRS
jgi:hypothetical protein